MYAYFWRNHRCERPAFSRCFRLPLAILLSACDSSDTAPSNNPPAAEPHTAPDASPPSAPGIRVGAELYDQRGELWGTIVEMRDAYTFPNGVTEPAVRVDYGPRMGDPPVPPQWLPRRSAERFRIE
jgi:hypothetical protein